MPTQAKHLLILVMISSLSWGVLLNGFFVYLPSLAQNYSQDLVALVSSVGWGIFGVVLFFAGKDYLAILSGPRMRNRLLGVNLVLVLMALVLTYVFDSPLLAWLLVCGPFAFLLLSALNRALLKSETSEVFAASGWLGAAPLIGLTIGAIAISSFEITSNFILIAVVVCGLGLLVDRGLPEPGPKVIQPTNSIDLIPKNLILFGLTIGMSVSLANSFVYFRTAEALASGENLAGATSVLILLASVVGIGASLLSTLPAVQRRAPMPIAILGSIAVLASAITALLPGNYALLVVVGILLGFGFGLVNGLELRLVRQIGGGVRELPILNSRFLLVTTLPYLVAPSLGQLLFGITSSTAPVFVASAFFALVALLIIWPKDQRSSSEKASA